MLFAQLQPGHAGQARHPRLLVRAHGARRLRPARRRWPSGRGTTETAAVARQIRAEEEAMAMRLGEQWDRTVEASLKGRDAAEALDDYLADAHALETQAIDAARARAEARGHARARADPREPPRRDRPPPRADLERRLAGPRRLTQPRQGRRAAAGRAQLERLLRRPARHAGQAGDVRLRLRAPRDRRRTSSSRAWRGSPATARPRWSPTQILPDERAAAEFSLRRVRRAALDASLEAALT